MIATDGMVSGDVADLEEEGGWCSGVGGGLLKGMKEIDGGVDLAAERLLSYCAHAIAICEK